MKRKLIFMIYVLLFTACKENKPKKEIASNFKSVTEQNDDLELVQTQKIDTLNWDDIKISNSNLGQFPYFNPPKGFEFDEEKSLDYSKLIFYINTINQYFEGKTFTTRFETKRGVNNTRPQWNQVLFDKSYNDFITTKGGVLLFEGNIPKETLKKIGASNVSKYIIGDVYNNPTKIYAIHQPKNKVLIQITSSTAGANMGIISIQDFEQTITVIDSETIKKELDDLGHIALYINFETGKSRIKADSYQIISEIVNMLALHPELKIAIEGHTDADGDEDNNQRLSENRAKAVVLSLIDEGIDISRLESIGYGESKPLEDNNTDEGKAKNRRVELRKIQ